MMHKPSQRKEPKKFGKEQPSSVPKLPPKNSNVPQPRKLPGRVPSIPEKVEKLQKNLEKVQENVLNNQLQELLIEEIKGIKSELKEIKYHIGLKGNMPQRSVETYEEEEEEQNIMRFHQQQAPISIPQKQEPVVIHNREVAQKNPQRMQQSLKQQLFEKEKKMTEIGKIQPYMKDFKLEGARSLMPYYQGYHKKSSKPVIIKYCSENQSMDPVFHLYEKLWKNIVKAKHICINKVYDLNQPLASHILVLQANKLSLEEIAYPPNVLLPSILRGLQFFHQCGYLYRNLHPNHIMQSFQDNIVLIDLKYMKRFVDLKGKLIQVVGSPSEQIDQFSSNARLRGVNEGRKDDLECLGYLALYILEGYLPWNIRNIVEIRSRLTLKQLFGKYESLFEFMVIVSQMSYEDTPHYDKLVEILRSGSY